MNYRVAASKPKALGMVHAKETIPNPFDCAQGSAALEAATLFKLSNQIRKSTIGLS
jgi:hypothetical protein